MSEQILPLKAEQIPVTAVMTRNVLCAGPDLAVTDLVQQMLCGHIGCVPIVDDNGRPRGIVTKTDLVALLTTPERISAAKAGDVMMPLAIVLEDHATVAHCARMMALEDFHHVMIVERGVLVGVVSSQDVVRWLVSNEAKSSAA